MHIKSEKKLCVTKTTSDQQKYPTIDTNKNLSSNNFQLSNEKLHIKTI